MLLNQTREKLYSLGLKTLARALDEQASDPRLQALCCEERFGLAVDAEVQQRANTRLERMIKQANFKVNACPEDIDYRAPRGLDRQVMSYLVTSQYVEGNQNVLITGPTGVGKTWISCALGHGAIRKGYTVYSIRLSRMFEEMYVAIGDTSIRKYRAKLAKYNVLIIDDWGLAPVSYMIRHELLELLDDRCGKGSTIITSQLPVEKWHAYLGDPTVADAILDRLVQCAHRIELVGDSLRKQELTNLMSKEVASHADAP